MDEVTEIIYETDLTPVLEALETLQQTQQAQFAQLHADANLVFLAICAFAGIFLGCMIAYLFIRMWSDY